MEEVYKKLEALKDFYNAQARDFVRNHHLGDAIDMEEISNKITDIIDQLKYIESAYDKKIEELKGRDYEHYKNA